MRKHAFLIGVLAVVAVGCGQPSSNSDPNDAILFSTIGNAFFQDFIFVIRSDGSRLRPLLAPQGNRSFLFAHGNSLRRELALVVHEITAQGNVENHLYLFRPSNGDLRRLVNQDGTEAIASLSPNEANIVFEFTPNGLPPQIQLWILDLGTGQVRKLTNPVGLLDRFPKWRPDGQEILFLRLRFFAPAGVESTLMRISSAGGEPSIVFGAEEEVGAATYAPSGEFFAVWSRAGLETVEAASLKRRVILPLSSLQDFDFVGGLIWSRTEDKIAFALFNRRLNEYELWTVHSDGTDAKRIHSVRDGRIFVGAFVQQ
jgi:hypothetical protein